MNRFHKTGLAAAALFLLLVGLFSGGVTVVQTAANPAAEGLPTVIVDAGHGDFDPGALGADGTAEKDINLGIALRLRDLLSAAGYPVILTRDSDSTMADADAVSIAQKKRTDTHNRSRLAEDTPNAVLLSIHQNAFSDHSQHGAQLFYGTLDPRSELLCGCIQESFVRLLQPDNRREVKRGTSSVYLLTNTDAPTALIECGFLSNPQELEKLKDPAYQQQVAFAIFVGFCDYLEALKQAP